MIATDYSPSARDAALAAANATSPVRDWYAVGGFAVMASCSMALLAVLYFETVVRQSPPVLEACPATVKARVVAP